MSDLTQTDLEKKYLVDDLPGAARAGARLNGILQKIDQGATLTALARSFLADNGLEALLAFATEELDGKHFRQWPNASGQNVFERQRQKRKKRLQRGTGGPKSWKPPSRRAL